ncbi:methyl-accepting chemotaxis protein [Azoarcus sp. KH32C]|uniref:methyl-accepting chemotaxis protein n=1 Tax=Azoarcus sp. KH32C TaxID=748247 RepID=UPI0002386C80|nr:methyl-accepting chemotaxis protein [Azoarcus sp. KH32C]BAL24891.1 putative methyl-accepting chemotaxis protein [Azoarcus sp. KH32C]
MNLYQKALVAPAITLVFLLLLAVAGHLTMSTQREVLDDLFNVRQQYLQTAEEVRSDVLESHARAYRLLMWADLSGSPQLQKDGKAADDELGRVVAKFDTWMAKPDLAADERALGEKIAAQIAKYRKSVSQAIDLADSDINMGRSALQTADDYFKVLDSLTDELVQAEQRISKSDYDNAAAAYSQARLVVATTLVLALAGAAVSAFLMARSIARPVREASVVAERIAGGDLGAQFASAGRDEIGDLLRSLQRMQENLRRIIGSMAGSADALGDSAGGMSSAAAEITRCVQEQSESLNAIAAAVEEMSVSITHVSDNAENARTVAERTVSVAETGKSLVDEAVAEINKIAADVSATGDTIHRLQETSQRISHIVDVIREIAGQTNLLALNAAIEAARAGEQGRGFAVVADEVRKLAERTSSSTTEINVMIEAIRDQTEAAVKQMDDATQQLGSGVKLMHDLQDPLDELQRSASVALGNLIDVSDAAREQAKASTLIAENVERLVQKSDINTHAAQRGEEMASNVHNHAGTLRELVSRFRR